MSRVALALVAALLGGACGREAPTGGAPPERAATPPSAGAAGVPAPGSAASADVSAPGQPPAGASAPLDAAGGLGLTGVGPGFAPPGAPLGEGTREAREARVFALLAGERPAGGLPVRAGIAKDDVWVREPPPPGARPPRVRVARVDVKIGLKAPVIQRIVRQNLGRFRMCYEMGLRDDPSAKGTVIVRFIVAKDGTVSNVNGAGGLPAVVTSCVARAFYGLTFPEPEGVNIVPVVAHISLEP